MNSPIKLRDLKQGDYVKYKKQKDNIIYAGEVIKGPFCECCGDPIEEETGIKKAELH